MAIEGLTASDGKLHTAHDELKAGNEELRTNTKKLIEELAEVKPTSHKPRHSWQTWHRLRTAFRKLDPLDRGQGGQRVDLHNLTLQFSRYQSAHRPLLVSLLLEQQTPLPDRKSVLPSVTVDTRRMKDKSIMALDSIPDTENRLKTVIQAVDTIKEV